MKTYKLTREFSTNTLSKLGGEFIDEFCKKALTSKLHLIKDSYIRLVDRSSEKVEIFEFGSNNCSPQYKTELIIYKKQAYSRIALGGSIGAGESYRDGDWTTPDHGALTRLIRIFVLNREALAEIESGIGSLFHPIQRAMHQFRKNTLQGAKENIVAHYDIGNDYFELFLDPTMLYSSAVFKSQDSTLEEASIEKIDRICRKLKLNPRHHILEIGTGWGAFAVHAAKNYGVKVTTTTISDQQYNYAKEKIKENALEDRVTLLKEDYRLLTGKFDKIVSIEMIEAVGLDHLETYFKKCDELLKDDGEMLFQAITIQDQFYEEAKKSVDFIQTHIFPGSGIPSIGSMSNAISKTKMRISHLEDFGLHYARTLNYWSKNLETNKEIIFSRGYALELYRLWQFYFSYCEGGFLERSIGCSQIKLMKEKSNATSLIDINEEFLND